MTTAAAILGLLGAIVPFVLWLLRRKVENDTIPSEARKRYEEETRKLIAARDTAGINRALDERLRAINRNTAGQGSNAVEEGRSKSS